MTGSRHQVLVMDDDANVRESIRLMLRHLGYLGETVASGKEALAKVATPGFDLLIAEYRPQRKEASGLPRQIRRLQPGLPIVLLTSDLPQSIPSEAVGVLLKPCSMKELGETVAKCLNYSVMGALVGLRVVVTVNASEFAVEVFGGTKPVQKKIVNRGSIVNETARTLNLELAGRRTVRLAAPDWIQAELEQRGYHVSPADGKVLG